MSKGLPRIAAYDLPQAHEIPAARAPWTLERSRAALLVHDMQRYFVNAFTPDASPIAPVIQNIKLLTACCRAVGIPVFYTAQRGNQDRRDRGLQADIWGPGMSTASEHQDIIEALAPQPGDHVLTKHRYSAFQRSNLEPLLRVRGRDQLIICGVYAHIGCMQTAADAFQLDIQPFFAADALGDFSRARHELALDYVAHCCGIPMTTAHIIEALP